MSTIVHVHQGLGLACGLRWSVLDAAGRKANASIRTAGRAIGASRYAIDDFGAGKYLGLYTPGALPSATSVTSATIGGHKARRIHSLALVFIAAIARSSNVQRERVNAILSAAPDGAQGQTRALVIIEGGRIVHDSLQARGRAADIVDEYRARGEDFQLFADRPEYDEASLIDLSELAAHAGKASLTRAIARHPAQRVLAWAALTAVALYGAHHRMVVMPHQRAQEARKKVEQDRTPLYLRALDEAMGNAGWSAPSLAQQIRW